MIYNEPNESSRTELEAALGGTSIPDARRALIDLAHYEDASWALEKLLAAVSDDRLASTAIMGIAAIARRHELAPDRRVWFSLFRALEVPATAGYAGDALDDIEMFGARFYRMHRGHSCVLHDDDYDDSEQIAPSPRD